MTPEQLAANFAKAVDRMVQLATVIELDRARARVRVEWSSGVPSAWLAVAQLGSAELPFWIPPSVGTQVLVISPGGRTEHGIVYPGPFSSAPPAGNFAGEIVGDGDVIASEISLVKHKHEAVKAGVDESGKPTP